MGTGRTIYFAGGGTGGHLFPGLAVAEEWRRGHADDRLVFVGSERGLEQKIVRAAGYESRSLPAVSLAHVWRRPVQFLSGNWRALRLAREWLRTETACGVVGLGGYASAPLVIAARKMGVPIVLLEQNVVPGKTNRWLARHAARVCCAFEETARGFSDSGRGVWTGNPVRPEIAALASMMRGSAERRKRLLILGGSLGSVGVNRLCLATLRSIEELRGWEIVHQTGEQDFETVQRQYQELGIGGKVQPFFDEMESHYAGGTLCVSRAGGTTLAELSCAGVPAVLVPYPRAAEDHQTRNADYYAERGAAELIGEAQGEQVFIDLLRKLIVDPDRLAGMRERMLGLAKPGAARDVVEVLGEVFSCVRD